MLVREIMSSPAVTIRPDDGLAEAARVLDRLSLTTLPVVGPRPAAARHLQRGRRDRPVLDDVVRTGRQRAGR